jgi:hypothetical protein
MLFRSVAPCIAYRILASAGLLAGASSCVDIPNVVPAPPTPMEAGPSIAFVQAQTTNVRSGTATLSFTNAVGAHAAIIVCFDYDSKSVTPAGPTGVTDTLGNAYNLVLGPVPGFDDTIYIAVAANSPPGRDTITVTLTGAPYSYFEVYAHEYAGIAMSNPSDQTSWTAGTSTAPDGMISGPIVTTAPNDLLFGFGQSAGMSAGGEGFLPRTSFDGNVTEDKVVNTVGTYQATATMLSGTHWTMLAAAFKGQ